MLKIKETRKLSWEAVREICINHNLYTRGCNEEYAKLEDYVRNLKNVTSRSIYKIAKDIQDHSDPKYSLEILMMALAAKCVSDFEVREN